MKVLFLANNDVGLYKFRYELILDLINKGEEVYISLPYGNYVDKLKEIGCKFIETNIDCRGTNPVRDLKLLINYKKIMDLVKPDVVLSYTIKPNIYGGIICSKKNVKYIPNITGLGTAVEQKSIVSYLILRLYRYALRKAQIIFFQNYSNMKLFSDRKILKSRYKILPGSGVNLEFYKQTEYPDNDEINFVFISRIMREKGIDQFLEAAKYIHKKYPNVNFHICGSCNIEYEKRIEMLNRSKIIVYHGLVDDMREIYKNMHCIIHPTYYPEGISNVLLESAASSRPIITTNRSGCKEVVENEINGLIVNEKDSKDLIKKIELFLNLTWNQKKTMGLNGRKKVEREFDRRVVINEYIKELEKIKGEIHQ